MIKSRRTARDATFQCQRQPAVFFLIALCCIPSIDAFASYLLTKSNCWTDLSTEEVIMNYRVTAAADSDDPRMHVRVVDDTTEEQRDVLFLPTDTVYPHTVSLQVWTDRAETDPDYQWVIEVSSTVNATVVDGACDDKRRGAGKARELAQVVIPKRPTDDVKVWAGWAAGHQAVRLTPVLQIRQGQPHGETGGNKKAVDEKEEESPQVTKVEATVADPMERLLTEEGCTKFKSLSAFEEDVFPGKSALTLMVLDSDETKNELTVGLEPGSSRDWTTMVLQSSDGATFVDAAGSPCPHRLLLKFPVLDWPKLVVHKDAQALSVWGLVEAFDNTKHKQYRHMTPLQLENEPPQEEKETKNKVKQPDRQDETTAKEALESQKKARDNLAKLAEEAKRKMQDAQKMGIVADKVNQDIKLKPKDKALLSEAKKFPRAENVARLEKLAGAKVKMEAQKLSKEDRHIVSSRIREAVATNAASPDSLVFPTYGSYLSGMAVLLVASATTIQVCLTISRRHKGRLDL